MRVTKQSSRWIATSGCAGLAMTGKRTHYPLLVRLEQRRVLSSIVNALLKIGITGNLGSFPKRCPTIKLYSPIQRHEVRPENPFWFHAR